ncbi:MAG: hypothetical protein OXG84_04760 [Chloroflexi bacterium]|nr:hypothetical protein [Chloroflexota bacterium]
MAGFEVGSIWRKWDLHVHSPSSILANEFKSTDGRNVWDSYVDRIEETDIQVLGITDYFTVDGYKKILEYREDGRLDKVDLVLPNVELRLNVLGHNKRVNLHVIFSNTVLVSDIERHFLEQLHITVEGDPQSTDFKEKLMPETLEELGHQLKLENRTQYGNLTPMQVGATAAVLDFEEICARLRNPKFLDKYVLVLAEDNLPPWHGQSHLLRKILTQKTDFMFTSNPSSRIWYLGRHHDYETPQHFVAEFKSLKPCIHGSDAHELFFIGHPCSNRGVKGHDCKSSTEDCNLRFCWIKADPTFDGFKQVLYEPEDRVFIGPAAPEFPKSNYTISEVSFSETYVDSELTIGATAIPINHSLVAVTGGKGAGKTAFVDLIANCFVDRASVLNENSFVWRICEDHKPGLRTSIAFSGADSFEKDVFDSSSLLSHVDVAYIEQGQLDAAVSETYKLTERIEQLVMSTTSMSDRHEFDSLLQQIKDIQDQIGVISDRIIQLSADISVEVQAALQTRKKTLKVSIEDLAEQIENDSIDSNEMELAQKAIDQVANLEGRYEKLKQVSSNIKRAKSILTNDLTEFNSIVLTINRLVQELEFKVEVLFELAYPSAESIARIADKVEEEINSTLKVIDQSKKDMEEQNKRVADHSKLIDEKRIAEDALGKIEAQLSEFDSIESQIQDLRDSRASHYRDMLDKVALRKQTFQRMMTSYLDRRAHHSDGSDPNRSNILAGIDFSARMRFSAQSFLTKCRKLFDERSVKLKDGESHFDTTLDLFASVARGDDSAIGDLSINIESLVDDNRLRNSLLSGKGLSDFYELLYGNHFALVPEVSYKKVPIKRLSIGQKATVLIKLYLADGTRPIIIDSHDDHLDNKFIYDELIPAIVQAKKGRQIILVSNNANVVVNADAEQVIVAEHNDNNITYVSGSLENPCIREKAIEVLEGGELAFKERKQKYRIP